MTLWSRLIAMLSPTPPDSDDVAPPHQGMTRVHVFYGTFANSDDLLDYCFFTPDDVTPEQLTLDLSEATIVPAHVDPAFGPDIPTHLARFLGTALSDDVFARIGAANSVVILPEEALGGLPYALNDTPKLTYLGPFEVPEKES